MISTAVLFSEQTLYIQGSPVNSKPLLLSQQVMPLRANKPGWLYRIWILRKRYRFNLWFNTPL